MKKYILFYCMFPQWLFAQEPSAEMPTETVEFKTEIENPLDLRDPFKSPLKAAKGRSKKLSNVNQNIDELLAEVIPTGLKLTGVVLGKEKRAYAQAGTQFFTLKEGMKIGPEKIELKAILPTGIVLVEKIVNVYGKDEYLETIIPLEGLISEE